MTAEHHAVTTLSHCHAVSTPKNAPSLGKSHIDTTCRLQGNTKMGAANSHKLDITPVRFSCTVDTVLYTTFCQSNDVVRTQTVTYGLRDCNVGSQCEAWKRASFANNVHGNLGKLSELAPREPLVFPTRKTVEMCLNLGSLLHLPRPICLWHSDSHSIDQAARPSLPLSRGRGWTRVTTK